MLFHDFSDRAEECIRFAQRAKSTHDRDLFMAIARAWYGLDDEAARTAHRSDTAGAASRYCNLTEGGTMARKYSRSASKDVERAMRKRKRGTLKSGKGGRGGKVKSRKQAIAIGLSEARKKGKKVPKRKSKRKKRKSKR